MKLEVTRGQGFIFLVCVLSVILLSQPISIVAYLPSRGVTFVFRAIVLILLFLFILRKKWIIDKKLFPILSFLFVYTIIQFLFNTYSFNHYLDNLYNLLFVIVCYIAIRNSEWIKKKFNKYFLIFSLLISVSVILAGACLLWIPSVFLSMYVDDYPMLYNPLIGGISFEALRPCWYFYEPSYCGFFLGLSLIIVLQENSLKKIKKIVYGAVLLTAIAITNSMGTLAYLLAVLMCMFFKRITLQPYFKYLFYLSIFAFNIVFTSIDFDESKYREGNSFNDRVERMENSKKYLSRISFPEMFLGAGADEIARVYGKGESNGYMKLIIEYGLLFSFVFFLVVDRLVRELPYIRVYSFLSLFSVILFLTPIFFIPLLYYVKARKQII